MGTKSVKCASVLVFEILKFKVKKNYSENIIINEISHFVLSKKSIRSG